MEDKLYIVMQKLIDENDQSGLSDYVIQFPFGNIEDVEKFNQIVKEIFSLKEIEKTDRNFTIDISSDDYRVKMSSPTKYDTQPIQIEDIQDGKDNAKIKIVELNKEETRNFFKKLVKAAKIEEIYPQEEKQDVRKKHPHLLQGGINPPNTSRE